MPSTNQPQNAVVGINPKTGQVINNALCTLYIWTGLGQPCEFRDPQDHTQPVPAPYPAPQNKNTVLYVLLGVLGASAITYMIVKNN